MQTLPQAELHLIDADDWRLVYDGGELVYSGHGGSGFNEGLAIGAAGRSLATCLILECPLSEEAGEWAVENAVGGEPATLQAFVQAATQAGISLEWQ
jgi:hypothetical protein